MGDHSHIQWTDATWNPVTGCSKVSQGCKHCYALRDWPRLAAPRTPPNVYTGRAFTDVMAHPERLDQPLRWRKPRRVFVNSMSDLFHESVPFEFIEKVFGVMANAKRHTFQVLTKRPERMRDFTVRFSPDGDGFVTLNGERAMGGYRGPVFPDYGWPLPNVWLGVSVEDQATADERIPLLLQTPAAVRFVSYEPALSAIDFTPFLWGKNDRVDTVCQNCPRDHDCECGYHTRRDLKLPAIDWIIAGGESGPKARPCDVAWLRSTVEQCKAAGVPCFVKQLGANVTLSTDEIERMTGVRTLPHRWDLRDRKGGDMAEWPEDLRVRELPR